MRTVQPGRLICAEGYSPSRVRCVCCNQTDQFQCGDLTAGESPPNPSAWSHERKAIHAVDESVPTTPRKIGRVLVHFRVRISIRGTQHTQKGTPPQNPRQAAVSDSVATMQVTSPYVSFRMREWTLNDGLPVPLKAVAQTPDGYLWITTFDGLVRFDGARFTRYTTDNTPAFRSHDLLGLYVTDDGTLWTGGRDGWVYRLRDGTWTAYDLTDILLRPLGAGVCRGCKWHPLGGEYRADRCSLRWDCLDARPTAHS